MRAAIKLILVFLMLSPVILTAQSIVDIGYDTELAIGAGAEVCADIQSGNGILEGPGLFCGALLPVELVSFTSTVNGNDVILNWATAAEENNSGFEMERSDVRGQMSDNWRKIGFVNGTGNSNIAHDYTFTDANLNPGKYRYRLKQIDFNGNSEYFELQGEVNIGAPKNFSLSQNYPNPFNPVTTIAYDIPREGNLSLKVFDMTGKEVATLVNLYQSPGYYKVIFNLNSSGISLTSGTYFYKLVLQSNGAAVYTAVKKMIVIK